MLNGYRIDTDPTNAGGGMSQWSFGTKDGGDYFVKMFLSPKFPSDDGPGGAAAKARKREVCLAFERRHVEIARRLDPSKPGAGNLVVPCDFFRVDSTYVKVMPRVHATELPDVRDLTGFQILVLLRSVAFSLRMLHEQHVVHGDIKPDNVMVERPNPELYVSKLIDFDEAYVAGEPPLPQHIVGDPIYYSPELLRYIKKDETLEAATLGTASDIFSFGLFLHRFLVGRLPTFDKGKVNYPAEALLARHSLDISAVPVVLQPFLARMLAVAPDSRPSIEEFIGFLETVEADALVPSDTPAPGPPTIVTAPPAPTAGRTATPPTRSGPAAPAVPGAAPGRPAPARPTPARPTPGRPTPTTPPAAPAGRPGATPPTPPTAPGARPAWPAPKPTDRPARPTETGGLRSTMGRRKATTDDSST